MNINFLMSNYDVFRKEKETEQVKALIKNQVDNYCI